MGVALGAWEARSDGGRPDFPDVATTLQEEMKKYVADAHGLLGDSGKVRVFYVCGTDHAERCNLKRGLSWCRPDVGVIIVPRAGEKSPKDDAAKLVFVAEPIPGAASSFSSTKVRSALKSGDKAYIEQALSPAASAFLLSPTDAQKDMFRRDFLLI